MLIVICSETKYPKGNLAQNQCISKLSSNLFFLLYSFRCFRMSPRQTIPQHVYFCVTGQFADYVVQLSVQLHLNSFEMKDNPQASTQQEFTGKYIDSDRQHGHTQSKSKKRRPNALKMNVSDTQYQVVKFVGKKIMKWQLDYSPIEDMNFDLCWTDNAVKPEILARMQSHQKINHFPGMYILSRKNNLGKNLMRLKKYDPEEYNFFPQTFVLPGDYAELRHYHQNRKPGKAQTFIVKPEASCQGRGIYLTRNIERIKNGDRCVVQRYLHKPFLIEGLKFDLRIYVLITGTDPLRIYVYEEGLVRFATEPYVAPRTDNLEEVCMHLTNYAINKDSPNFVFNQSTKQMNVGHKRSLTSVYAYLAEQGYNIEQLKEKINDMFIKTFISGHPVLSSTYRSCQPNNFSNNMCFELLGFDVILDSKFNPILLEVNYTPSFSTDTPLDSLIKKNAIRDTLRLINITEKIRNDLKVKRDKEVQDRITSGKRKKWSDEEKVELGKLAQMERDLNEDTNVGGFTKIYPVDDYQVKKYQRFFQFAHQSEGLVYPTNSSAVIASERKLELQKQLMKTYHLQPSQPNLRKNSSAKLKTRQTISSCKVSRPHNVSSDKLSLDPTDGSSDLKTRLSKLDSEKAAAKGKKKKCKQIEQKDGIQEEVYLFSNENLKDIVAIPTSLDRQPVKCFSKKKPQGSLFKE